MQSRRLLHWRSAEVLVLDSAGDRMVRSCYPTLAIVAEAGVDWLILIPCVESEVLTDAEFVPVQLVLRLFFFVVEGYFKVSHVRFFDLELFLSLHLEVALQLGLELLSGDILVGLGAQ